jgi:hypothetical protein
MFKFLKDHRNFKNFSIIFAVVKRSKDFLLAF